MYSLLLHKGTKLPQGATSPREQLPFRSISLKEKGIKLLWKTISQEQLPKCLKKENLYSKGIHSILAHTNQHNDHFFTNKFCHLTTKTKWVESYEEFYG
jgi:hypothetical protein